MKEKRTSMLLYCRWGAGEKQRMGRDYDFPSVVKWFAERADMIVVMFDAHKLDISDELRARRTPRQKTRGRREATRATRERDESETRERAQVTIEALRPHFGKIRIGERRPLSLLSHAASGPRVAILKRERERERKL